MNNIYWEILSELGLEYFDENEYWKTIIDENEADHIDYEKQIKEE